MSIFRYYIANKAENRFVLRDVAGISASIFVIIPCYNEPDILESLNSLASCIVPESSVAVLIVVNSSEDSTEDVLAQNTLTISSIENWKRNQLPFFEVFSIQAPDLPQKYAGVGWARKIGMDAAVRELFNSSQEDGIIVSLDADSTVLPNYLRVIEKSFKENRKANFFTINFAHPLDHCLSSENNEGIIRYELHMRYYRNAMKWCGYPHSIHTVGSSFAVRASAYVKQGGMNRKKAGEDFYFLHKMILLGDYGNINSTTVFPSSRQSGRVPFGTGAAMKKWADGNSELMSTYNLDAFIPLKQFFEKPAQFWRMNEIGINAYLRNLQVVLRQFIEESGTIQVILDLEKNCANAATFSKRFFHHLNAFWILKYLNFAHENIFSRGELYGEATKLLQEMGIDVSVGTQALQLLDYYRDLDKEI